MAISTSIASTVSGALGQNGANIAAVGLPFLGSRQNVQFIFPGSGTVLSLDASLKESHVFETTPTDFPVEDGSSVSDHLITKPIKLDISGIISDNPISLLSTALTTVTTAYLPNIGIVAAAAGRALLGALSSSPSHNAYTQFITIQNNKIPLTVVTNLNRYTNMYITSVTFPRDPQTGKALNVDLKLQQLILVAPKTINIQIFKEADLAASQAHMGKQEAEESFALKQFKKGDSLITGIPQSAANLLGGS